MFRTTRARARGPLFLLGWMGFLAWGMVPFVSGDTEEKELAMTEQTLPKPESPPWRGSQEGISEEVLPPWTPLEVEFKGGKEQSIRVQPWGREYEFASLFPTRIESAGQDILAGPIGVSARVNGQEERWAPGTVSREEQTPARVRLKASTASHHLALTGTITGEYDGCLRIDWSLTPASEGETPEEDPTPTLEELTFEIPLRAEHAKYLYHFPGKWGSTYNAGALPEEGFTGGFRPFLWLGDEERGLAWFSESDQNWFHEEDTPVTEIVRDADRVILRLHLVSIPLPLREKGEGKREKGKPPPSTLGFPLSYSFGLQATPVKPNPEDVWDYRICHAGNYGIETQPVKGEEAGGQRLTVLDRLAELGVRTICFHEHWTDIQSYTSTTHGEDLHRLVQACHERGLRLLLYFGYLMSDRAPEWPDYSDECLVFPRTGHYHRQPEQDAYIVCYRSHWQDFMARGIARMMDEYDIDGVYLDGTANPWGCANTRHGCGYIKPDGSIGTTYPFWDTRKMMRRIYTIVKTRKPHGLVNVHQSTCMTIPTLAWATSYWDGEQLGSLKPGPFALEVLPLDAFRTEFMGHPWGVPAEFLCYERPYTYHQALGFTLLHDVLVRGHGLGPNLELESRLWALSDAFGRKEAEWLPYWRNQDFVSVTPASAKASLYRHDHNGVLLIVSNLGPAEAEVTVTLHRETLGLPEGVSARDALNGETLSLEEGTLRLSLPSLGWRLIWIEGTHIHDH